MSKPFTPRVYQKEAIDFLMDNPRCLLLAAMGLGKTVSALTAASYRQLTMTKPILVVAPKRVAVSTWPDEVAKWDHLRDLHVVPIVGSLKERIRSLNIDAPVYTTNYEQLPWLIEHFQDKWPFDHIIADESTKLKSFRLRQGGARARALGWVAHTHVKWFQGMTGTFTPNGLIDTWGQMWFVDRGERLGRTFSAFTQRWFKPNPNGFGIQPLNHALEEITDKLRDVCLTIDPADHFDLAQPIVNDIYVTLPSAARKQYADMEKKMFAEIEGQGVEAFNAASRTMKCLQMAGGTVYTSSDEWKVLHDAKLEALEEVIEEAAGMPVLVAYHFKSDLARIKKAFKQAVELDHDPETLRRWNAGKIPLLLAHPASAGHGLNMQDGGNILCFFSHWWNMEERLQIIERIGPVRQMQAGHNRPMYIYNILASDTIDELVMERHRSKKEVSDILNAALKRRKT